MYFFKYNIKNFTSLFLLGICLAQICYYYKNYLYLFLFIIIILFIKFNNYKLLLASITILLGFGFICWHINKFNQERYCYSKLENHPMVVQGTIIGIPKVTERFVVFDFIINDVNKVRLKWFNPNNRLTSGDYWQLLIKLKKPRNFSTKGSFDLEKAFFIERINAVGKVVAGSDNILKKSYDARKFNFRYFIDRYRLKIADLKLNDLNLAKKDLILALGLGIKQNISPADLLTFQNTGTIHLLAISGLHLSLVAGFCFYITHILCKKFCSGKILEQVSAIKIAIIVSLAGAWTYALLVGFGVATNRALIMSSIYLLAIIFKKNINSIEIYCLTLLAILILEPFESLSYGFWLSFWSVGILLYKKPNNLITTNLVMLIGLLPFSALFFGKISLIAIIANLIAVPWVSFIILPCILAGLVFSKNLLIFADFNLQLLIITLDKLEHIPYAFINIAIPNLLIFFISIFGSLWLLAPKGLLNRGVAIICFLPIFFNKVLTPNYKEAIISVLDVGQGLSVIIKLKNHILLYDAGPNNKVAVNYFKYFNYKTIEHAIISHPDSDHIGGLVDISKQLLIKNTITNCESNTSWSLDGVNFELICLDRQAKLINKNDNSCLLKISTAKNSMLLTGDISKKAENFLIQNNFNQLKADILLIPHHGSSSSSSVKFIEAVSPKYAVVSAGYLNSYGHPKQSVINKYLVRNIKVLNTIDQGSIDFIIKPETIDYSCYRINHKNFWNY